MQAEDLVSIIVPVYNAAAYIEQTISMVISQTYTNWELILVDDCSSDKSVERIREVMKEDSSQRIRLFCMDTNQGAARTRNYGIAQARGRYVAFLDADDIWFPEKLQKELDFLHEKKAAFVCTAYEFGDEQARGTGKVVHVPPVMTYKKALSRTVIFTTTVLLDTELIARETICMPDVESEDTATWWSIMKQGFPAYGLDEVLAIYRRPPGSLSSNKCKAVKRIWNLYRKQENLSIPESLFYLFFWAVRATLRRI